MTIDYAALRAVLADLMYAPLIAARDWLALADLMNVRPMTATPNPVERQQIIVAPSGIEDVIPYLSEAEKAAIATLKWRDVTATVYAEHAAETITIGDQTLTAGTGADILAGFFLGIGSTDLYVDQAVRDIINEGTAGHLAIYLELLRVTGTLGAATYAAIVQALTQPDPTWQEYIYEYGESVAQANGWPRVRESDVQKALGEWR